MIGNERAGRDEQHEGQPGDRPERRDDEQAGKKPARPLPAGPHSDPELMNPDATPGAGTLPPTDEDDDPNMGSTG